MVIRLIGVLSFYLLLNSCNIIDDIGKESRLLNTQNAQKFPKAKVLAYANTTIAQLRKEGGNEEKIKQIEKLKGELAPLTEEGEEDGKKRKSIYHKIKGIKNAQKFPKKMVLAYANTTIAQLHEEGGNEEKIKQIEKLKGEELAPLTEEGEKDEKKRKSIYHKIKGIKNAEKFSKAKVLAYADTKIAQLREEGGNEEKIKQIEKLKGEELAPLTEEGEKDEKKRKSIYYTIGNIKRKKNLKRKLEDTGFKNDSSMELRWDGLYQHINGELVKFKGKISIDNKMIEVIQLKPPSNSLAFLSRKKDCICQKDCIYQYDYNNKRWYKFFRGEEGLYDWVNEEKGKAYNIGGEFYFEE